MFRAVCVSFILLCLSLPAAPAAAEGPEEDLFAGAAVLERDALLAAVAARNPTLAAARQAWEAAASRAPQERALDDPMISYGLAPLSVAADVPFGHEIEVRQPLPWPGRREARVSQADAEADAALQDSRELLLELAEEASRLYDDWYLVHRALEVNEHHRHLLETFREVAAARYAAGLAPQQDPIQAEVEAAKMLQEREGLEAEREMTRARLDALLHRRPELPLPPPPGRLPEPAPLDRSTADLQEAAVAARPELAGLDAMVRGREAGRALALLENRPDVEVMASYSSMWMDTEHRFMAGVEIGLPIRKEKIAAARTEAESRLAAARTQREAAEMRIRAEVQEAATRYAATLRQLALHRDRVLPATRDQIRAARAGFESGGSFLALIEAESNLRDAEMREHEILTEAWRRRAMLERALGTSPAVGTSPPSPLSHRTPLQPGEGAPPPDPHPRPLSRERERGEKTDLREGGGAPSPVGWLGDGRGGQGVRFWGGEGQKGAQP